MFEWCSVKQMIVFIISVTALSLVVLVVESQYQTTPKKDNQSDVSYAGTSEDQHVEKSACLRLVVIEPCRKCLPWEKERLEACNTTGFIKVEQCEDEQEAAESQSTTVSCPPPSPVSTSQEAFWVHEGVMTLLGVVFSWLAYSRRRLLDKALMDKVTKQIDSGV